jgi:hypothetical protein
MDGHLAAAMDVATEALLRFRPEVGSLLDELVDAEGGFAPDIMARA